MSATKRIAKLGGLLLVCVGILVALGSLATASALAGPAWSVKARWADTNLPPGGKALILVRPENVSDTPTSGPITVTLELPKGVTRIPPTALDLSDPPKSPLRWGIEEAPWSCTDELSGGIDIVTCVSSEIVRARDTTNFESVPKGSWLMVRAAVAADATGSGELRTTVSGGGAPAPATDVDAIPFDATPAPFGFDSSSFVGDAFDVRAPLQTRAQQAATHPYEMRIDFDVNLKSKESPPEVPGHSGRLITAPSEDLRTIETTLPAGMIGNPEATPKCEPKDFLAAPEDLILALLSTKCPADTQVGTISLDLSANGALFTLIPINRIPVYNLVPPKGVPADFGFKVGAYFGHIYPSLDPAHGYAIKATVPFITSLLQVRGNEFTMWGVPSDPAHDVLRFEPENSFFGTPSDAPRRPLLTLPADCHHAHSFSIAAESWQHPGAWTPTVESDPPVSVDGCDDPRFRFEPEIRLQPTSRAAGGPTGLDVHLEVPQRNQEVDEISKLYAANGNLHGIDTPPMKKALITFPEGMTLSTSAAQGLGVCSGAEIGIGTNDPVRCPDSSRYGSLTIHTPILPADEPMQGDIYIARKGDNPFHNFLSMYFVIHDTDRGLLVKLPGKIDLDPKTGQIKTTFDELPQFPVSDMTLAFKGGVRAGLVNPATCGKKTIRAEFFSWHDPDTPIVVDNSYEITQKPDGGPCVHSLAERQFKPDFSAGTVNPNAGSYSPFVFRLQRGDEDQEFSQLQTTLPPGLLANLSKLSECPEAGIRQAEDPSRTGTAEALFPSCPASSQLGTTDVGSGVGQVITYIPGKAYLAGPYRGAPLSMVVITPIVAGPYDLGVIAVRSAIHVDGARGQASIQTDPFPLIYEGIPVRIRDIRVKTDTPQTTINPTNCNPLAVTAHLTGTGGNLLSTADDTAVDLQNRFQAANCATLPFKPKLSFELKGGTKRGQFPALQATLKGRPGDANIARSSVVLPRSEFIEQGHIRTVCTRVQFAADQCPAGSIYGKAEAKSPLFDEVLSGPVYLRSNGGARLLPDLVVKLNGKISVSLAGFVDSVNGRVRNIFDVIPDAPVSFFKLSLQGGQKGLLVNHLDLCQVNALADVKFTAQNGKSAISHPAMGTSCKKAHKKHKKGKKR